MSVTGDTTNSVIKGFARNLMGFGEIRSARGSTTDISHTAKIAGITLEP